ncbi:MAG: acetyltransferase [Anaerostipes sp.]|jgi:sugar O-acyltransferase (sialic acid O-acetyltransferase NeuD family)|nr:acetyltransferase [Anaerostipes sp.]MDD3747458.1 acetyltransferase [Anaerostipes sp.]
MSKSKKRLIIVGASGHGKVILDLAVLCGYQVLGFLDDGDKPHTFQGCQMLGNTNQYETYKDEAEFVIAIGNQNIREQVVQKMQGVQFATLIHPRAVIGMNVELGEGTVVMANAVVNSGAKIGKHCILNTASVVEHDNILEDYVHISPGVVLAGTVQVGKKTHVGVGVVVRNNIRITKDCTIGVGAVVVEDIVNPGIYIGVPAKERE